MLWWQWLIIPLMGALIGWITNVLAIMLLFRPYRPYRIPLVGWKLQGLVPKRHGELARRIGQVIEEELLSVEEILHRFNTPEHKKQIVDAVVPAVFFRLNRKIPAFIPGPLRDRLGGYIREALEREAPEIFDHITDKIILILSREISLGSVVEDKINHYDLKELERIILSVASRELRHIEFLGGLLGFIIGLFQVGLMTILQSF